MPRRRRRRPRRRRRRQVDSTTSVPDRLFWNTLPPAGRSPIQGVQAGGNVSAQRVATRRGIPTGSSSRRTVGASQRPRAVDDPRRSRQPTTPSGVRSCTTLRPLERDGDIRSNRPWRQEIGRSFQTPSRERGWKEDTGTTRLRTASRRTRRTRRQSPLEVCTCRNSDWSAEAARLFVAIERASARSRSKDLGGETKAHGRVGHSSSETAADGTDPSTEQSLEVDARVGMRIRREKRQRDPARFEHR